MEQGSQFIKIERHTKINVSNVDLEFEKPKLSQTQSQSYKEIGHKTHLQWEAINRKKSLDGSMYPG
jgi:hypothetical protein